MSKLSQDEKNNWEDRKYVFVICKNQIEKYRTTIMADSIGEAKGLFREGLDDKFTKYTKDGAPLIGIDGRRYTFNMYHKSSKRMQALGHPVEKTFITIRRRFTKREQWHNARDKFYEWESDKYGQDTPLSDDDKDIWIEGYLYAKGRK